MAVFPDIEEPSKVSEATISFRGLERSSAGYTMVLASSTLTKKEFGLEWSTITSTDKDTLDTFFNTNHSLSITWTHFDTSVEYTVSFKDDKLKFDYLAPGYWKTKLTLTEI